MPDYKNRAMEAEASSESMPEHSGRPPALAVFRPGSAETALGSDFAHPSTRGWLEAGWALLDPPGAVTEINEALCHWFEKPSGEIIGLSFWALLTQRCAEWSDSLVDLKSGSSTFAEVTLRSVGRDGAAVQWVRLERAHHPAGAFVRLNSILPPLEDLAESTWDEYLRTESAQREMFVRMMRAEAQLKNLTGRWPGVIFSQRADGSFRFVSPKIEELTGVPMADWQRKPHLFWQVIHESDVDELRARLKRAAQSREPMAFTYRIRHVQTGRVAYVLEHRHAMVSSGGLLFGYEGVWLDVTRQTIAERRLSSAAWKETLSVLTMGLAHDFGNIMAGIHALSESFLNQVEDQHPFREGLGLIQKNSLHASELVHRIINLHQGRTGECYYHNLNELATELADLVRKIIPRRVQFDLELAAAPLPIYLDSVELRQVVINLVLNAVDAMPRAGQLRIRTSLVHDMIPVERVHGVLPSTPCLSLEVSDTGCGIKARYLASIFDPFFTTKPMNKGSGLGLYNARLFVEKHRGAISVDSTEGTGTTFRLWLPQATFTEAETTRRIDTSQLRRSLLLVGRAHEGLDGTAEFLRVNNYHVVAVTSPESGADCLISPHYNFAAVMALAEPRDEPLLGWLAELRHAHPQLKLFLKAVGGDRDDLPLSLVNAVDLFIPPDLPQPGILEKISSAFRT